MSGVHPLLGRQSASLVAGHRSWEHTLGEDVRFLHDHTIRGRPVMPGAAFAEMALAAARSLFRSTHLALYDLAFERYLLLGDGPTRLRLHAVLTISGWRMEIHSRTETGWRRHFHCHAEPHDSQPPRDRLEQIRDRCPGHRPGSAFYRSLVDRGMQWAGAFRRVEEVWLGQSELLAVLSRLAGPPEFLVHPAALDACLQGILYLTTPDTAVHYNPAVLGIDRLCLHIPPGGPGRWYSHCRTVQDTGQQASQTSILSETGQLVAHVSGVRTRPVRSAASTGQVVEQRAPSVCERRVPEGR